MIDMPELISGHCQRMWGLTSSEQQAERLICLHRIVGIPVAKIIKYAGANLDSGRIRTGLPYRFEFDDGRNVLVPSMAVLGSNPKMRNIFLESNIVIPRMKPALWDWVVEELFMEVWTVAPIESIDDVVGKYASDFSPRKESR